MRRILHWSMTLPLLALAAPAPAQDTPVRLRPRITVPGSDTDRLSRIRITTPSLRPPGMPGGTGRRPGGVRGWRLNSLTLNPGMTDLLLANRVASQIKSRLDGKSVGYAVTVITERGSQADVTGGWARSAPNTFARAWTNDQRMTIASVSKTITDAALLRVMEDKVINLDTVATTYLPSDWTFSDSFKKVTLRELMSHNSGIRDCDVTYDGLKACAAADIADANRNPQLNIWTRYANANVAFLRIVLNHMTGFTGGTPAEQGANYVKVVNEKVFQRIGLPAISCKTQPMMPPLSYISATAGSPYDWANVASGVNWGDVTETCGSEGWVMSSRQLATFAHSLWFDNKILPMRTVDLMRDQGLGMMYYDAGQGLTAYYHNGFYPGSRNGGELNTLIIGFDNGITVSMIVNSTYNGVYLSDIAAGVRAGATS